MDNRENRHYRFRPGDLLLISKSNTHCADINPCKPYEHIVVCLTGDWFEQMENFFHEDFTACFTNAVSKNYRLIRLVNRNIIHLKQLCGQISKARQSTGIGNRALICAYLTEFLIYVNRAYYDALDSIKDDITENQKVNELIAFINDNLTEDLSLDYLAKNGTSVMNACYLCEFNDYSNFFQSFKREFGDAPSNYSKE